MMSKFIENLKIHLNTHLFSMLLKNLINKSHENMKIPRETTKKQEFECYQLPG